MPPLPKDPSTRRRRNRSSTARTLTIAHDVGAPVLPPDRDWHKMTRSWWRDLWASPMAPEYDASDLHGLYLLATLTDDLWTAEDPRARKEAAAEIRLQRQCFGLTPIDRRRLQWEIDRGEEAEESIVRRRQSKAPSKTGGRGRADPRLLLAE